MRVTKSFITQYINTILKKINKKINKECDTGYFYNCRFLKRLFNNLEYVDSPYGRCADGICVLY